MIFVGSEGRFESEFDLAFADERRSRPFNVASFEPTLLGLSIWTGISFSELSRNVLLTTRRVDGDRAAIDRWQIEQLRGRGDLIRLVIHDLLSQDQGDEVDRDVSTYDCRVLRWTMREQNRMALRIVLGGEAYPE